MSSFAPACQFGFQQESALLFKGNLPRALNPFQKALSESHRLPGQPPFPDPPVPRLREPVLQSGPELLSATKKGFIIFVVHRIEGSRLIDLIIR